MINARDKTIYILLTVSYLIAESPSEELDPVSGTVPSEGRIAMGFLASSVRLDTPDQEYLSGFHRTRLFCSVPNSVWRNRADIVGACWWDAIPILCDTAAFCANDHLKHLILKY